jgi:hypothetical protein
MGAPNVPKPRAPRSVSWHLKKFLLALAPDTLLLRAHRLTRPRGAARTEGTYLRRTQILDCNGRFIQNSLFRVAPITFFHPSILIAIH